MKCWKWLTTCVVNVWLLALLQGSEAFAQSLLARASLSQVSTSFEQALQMKLQQTLSSHEVEGEIKLRWAKENLAKFSRDNATLLDIQLPKIARKTKAYVTVEHQGKKKHLSIPADVVITKGVLMTTRDMARGEKLSVGMMKSGALPHSLSLRDVLTKKDLQKNWKVRRPLAQGHVILRRRLSELKPVEREQRVTIHYRKGKIHLKVQGIAKQRGEQFQRIKVLPDYADKAVDAIVIGQGIVEVE